MDYGNLLSKSLASVRNHRHMLALGVLAILGAGGGLGGASLIAEPLLNPRFDEMISQQAGPVPGEISPAELQVTEEFTKVFLIVMGCSWAVIGFLMWLNSRLAEGGLIASARQIAQGQPAGFAPSWLAGRAQAGSLIAIGLILLLPTGLLGLAYSLLTATLSLSSSAQPFDPSAAPDLLSVAMPLGYSCVTLALTIPLLVIRTLAERACVLENLPAGAAARRGLAVLRANPGSVIMVALIEFGSRVVLVGTVGGVLWCGLAGVAAAAMSSGSPQAISLVLLAALCCLTPPLLVAGGALQSFFSTLWTLAWLRWTEGQPNQEQIGA